MTGLFSKPVITDANILIDYSCNSEILKLMVMYYGAIYVPDVIFEEVHEMDETLAKHIGLTIIETEIDILEQAMEMTNKGTSLNDNICLLTAEKNGWICATNDTKARKECDRRGIPILWGLQIMLQLVSAKLLSKDEAEETAKIIRSNNKEIKREILYDFLKKLKEI